MARNRDWREFIPDEHQVPHGRQQDTGKPPPAQQQVRVQRSSRGRGGKTVTIITGLELPIGQLNGLAKALKAATGTGGTVQENTIVLQGDQTMAVLEQLTRRGYRPKRSGG